MSSAQRAEKDDLDDENDGQDNDPFAGIWDNEESDGEDLDGVDSRLSLCLHVSLSCPAGGSGAGGTSALTTFFCSTTR